MQNTKKIPLPLEGGCQCGSLRYKCTKGPEVCYACHCKNCQKSAGSAFQISAIFEKSSVTLSGVTPKEWTFEADSGNKLVNLFCPECGTKVAAKKSDKPDLLTIKAGTLDDSALEWLDPIMHVWASKKMNWFDLPKDSKAIDKQPEESEMKEHIALWKERHE
ncbi:glutathione-dependent formaldehyde-activating protein [Acrasis kona]|uniref:Glutathione-dependent formaldehyde-activating protein n=1 Tax=Acrasis kona TaxID=1008807 RepID=A0AAW2Z0E9_9EUKA